LARDRDVYFFEEPQYVSPGSDTRLARRASENVTVLTPQLPEGLSPNLERAATRALLDRFLVEHDIDRPVLWYYTPMALAFSDHLKGVRVYDCMDELSLFANAPPQLARLEAELIREAQIVFTGGRSLYNVKKKLHRNVFCFPSAVDAAHFRSAGKAERDELKAPQAPRIGFYGVLDERLDRDFLGTLAGLLADWQFDMIGPVVKIDEASLPRRDNIHYHGIKPYADLPSYLCGWDVALMPFALNDSTRFISPTKTLEYLAAGKPVISTPIADVVDPYGLEGLVAIAHTPAEAALQARAMLQSPPPAEWFRRIDALIAESSWDATVERMSQALAAFTQPRSIAEEEAG
jgi:UDP-galactopyranose mutase